MSTTNRGEASSVQDRVVSARVPRLAAIWLCVALLAGTAGLFSSSSPVSSSTMQANPLATADEGDPLDETLEYLWELLRDILGL